MTLTFDRLRDVNIPRCVGKEGFDHPMDSWTVLEWAGALTGEAGEAANAAKKIRRGDFGKEGTTMHSVGIRKFARELADTVIYADLCAARVGIDLGEAVREAFNAKSEELKLPHRI